MVNIKKLTIEIMVIEVISQDWEFLLNQHCKDPTARFQATKLGPIHMPKIVGGQKFVHNMEHSLLYYFSLMQWYVLVLFPCLR
jgi:hypothetical protein